MNEDLSVLVLSCDKNHDLCKWINKTCEDFLTLEIPCVLVTENKVEGFDSRIQAISCGDADFDERFRIGLKAIKSQYVLILLDDHFVHDSALREKIPHWMSFIKGNDFNALRIAKIDMHFLRKEKLASKYYRLLGPQPYEIDFHPCIWEKETLWTLIEKRDFTPWSLEPLFAPFLQDKRCGLTKECIEFDELVIRGHFIRKAYRKYIKGNYYGEKKVFPFKKSIAYSTRIAIFNYLPFRLRKFLSKTFGIKSVSSKTHL